MKYVLLFVLMFGVTFQVNGQTAKAFEKAGDKAFKNKDYGAALEYFSNALEVSSKKVSVKYKYAEVARLFYAYDFAVDYYTQVKESEDADKFPLTEYWLAEVHRSMGNYEKAKNAYQTYLDESKNKTFENEARQSIKDCDWAISVIAESDAVKIEHLNKRVNSPYSEFAPLFKNDTLYYTSFRYDNPNDDGDPPRKISKVLTSIKGAKGRPMKRKFNQAEKLTAHTTFSKNGKRIYYTICDYQQAMEIRCDIYFRDWNTKRKRWDKAKKLPEAINMPNTSSTHPNIGFNQITKEEMLLFTSNRPNGKGGLDIYYANIDSTGKFGKPTNLEILNTEKDEITPFFHHESNSIFFSSNGYQSLGGFDIYKSEFQEDQFSVAQHTGYPLNSSYNDMYFWLDADSTTAYFSSNRLGSMYLEKTNKSCCNDIYKAIIIEPEIPKPTLDTTIVEVPIKPEPPVVVIPEPPLEEVPPSTLEDFLPLALYFDNDEPDNRTRRNTTRKNYLETFDSYYSRLDEFRDEFSGSLTGESKIIAENDIDEFFEDKVLKGQNYLELFSNILLQRLQEGEQVEIFVKGYTSPRAKSDYNIHLGKRRISSVKNHFKTYQKGIFEPFIKSGKLILSERSFGETTARTNVNDDLNNQRLSIFSPEASLERRVEIVEIIRQ